MAHELPKASADPGFERIHNHADREQCKPEHRTGVPKSPAPHAPPPAYEDSDSLTFLLAERGILGRGYVTVVVVTGAAGFIGRALVRALLAADVSVIGIDRRPQRPLDGLTVLTADLLDGDERVHDALGSADAVFHLAGSTGVRDSRVDIAQRRHQDNPLAAAAVLAVTPPRIPLVVTSSSSVYGGCHSGRPCHEEDPLQPRGGYARSKTLVERLCQQRLYSGGSIAVVRPFTVAGPGQRPDMALARWITAARQGLPLTIFGSRHRTRDITDVDDVVRALIALAEREISGTVNIGTGTGHTLGAMVDAVARGLGVDVVTAVEPAQPEEAPTTLADTTRLHRTVGFTPVTNLPRLVARQAAASDPSLEAA